MITRRAACSCGQLNLTIEGESVRVSMCHCLECQRRTGAVISNQARFRRDQVSVAGKAATWTRTAESGSLVTYRFCPTCGSSVYWESESFPGYFVVARVVAHEPYHPCFAMRLGGVSDGRDTQGWRDCSHTAMFGAGKFGSAKLPMATTKYPGKLSLSQ